MKLLIAIISLVERADQLSALEKKLQSQIDASNQGENINLFALVDNKQNSRGKKRNACIDFAIQQGYDYICFFDDDDEPFPGYISLISKALEKNVDGIGFNGIITTDGENSKKFIHKFGVTSWYEHDGVYYRGLNHLNPVRVSIANKARFPEKNFGEDHIYSTRLLSLIKTSVYIDSELYHYLYVSKK